MSSQSVCTQPTTVLSKISVRAPNGPPQPTRAEVAIVISRGTDGSLSASRVLELEGDQYAHACSALRTRICGFTVDADRRERGSATLPPVSAWLRKREDSSMDQLHSVLESHRHRLAWLVDFHKNLRQFSDPQMNFTIAVLERAESCCKDTADKILSELREFSAKEEETISSLLSRADGNESATGFLTAFSDAVRSFRKINLTKAEILATGTSSSDLNTVVKEAKAARTKMGQVFKGYWPGTPMPHTTRTVESFLFPSHA